MQLHMTVKKDPTLKEQFESFSAQIPTSETVIFPSVITIPHRPLAWKPLHSEAS